MKYKVLKNCAIELDDGTVKNFKAKKEPQYELSGNRHIFTGYEYLTITPDIKGDCTALVANGALEATEQPKERKLRRTRNDS